MTDTQIIIPDLKFEAKGELSNDNVELFASSIREVLENINTDLKTDEDFAEAETVKKTLADVEKRTRAATEKAMSQLGEISERMDTLKCVSAEMQGVRLDLDKKIKARKAEIKQEMLTEARESINAQPLAQEWCDRLDSAMAGKRNFDSMQKALREVVDDANKSLDLADEELTNYSKDHPSIAPDWAQLRQKPFEVVQSTLQNRYATELERRKAAEAKAEADRLKKEEQERKDKEAQLLKEQREQIAANADRGPGITESQPQSQPPVTPQQQVEQTIVEKAEPHQASEVPPAPRTTYSTDGVDTIDVDMDTIRERLMAAFADLKGLEDEVGKAAREKYLKFKADVNKSYQTHLY